MCSAELSPGFLAGGAAPPRVYVPGAPLPRLRSAQGVRRTAVTKATTYAAGGKQEHVIIEDIIRRRRCCRRDLDDARMEIGDSPSKAKIILQGVNCSDMSSELLDIADLETLGNFPSRRESRELSAGRSRPLSGWRPGTPGSSPAARSRRPWSSPEVRPADREQQRLLSPAGSQVGFQERAKSSPSKRLNGAYRRRSPSAPGGDESVGPLHPPHWMHSGPFLEKGPPSPPVCAAEIFYGREGSRWQSPRLIETNPGFRGRPCLKATRRGSKTQSMNLQSMASEASCQPRWSLQASTVASSVDVADLSKIESFDKASKGEEDTLGGPDSLIDAGFDQSWSVGSGSPSPERVSPVGESRPTRRLRGETQSSMCCSEADVAGVTSPGTSFSRGHRGEAADVAVADSAARSVVQQSEMSKTLSNASTVGKTGGTNRQAKTAAGKSKQAGSSAPPCTPAGAGVQRGAEGLPLADRLSVAGIGADVNATPTDATPCPGLDVPSALSAFHSSVESSPGKELLHGGAEVHSREDRDAVVPGGGHQAGVPPAELSNISGGHAESKGGAPSSGCDPAQTTETEPNQSAFGAEAGTSGTTQDKKDHAEIPEDDVSRRTRRRPGRPDGASLDAHEKPEDEQLVEQFNSLADEQKVLLNIFDQIAHGKQWGKKLITLEDILKFCNDVNRRAMKRSDVFQGVHHVVMRARQIQVDWTGARGPAVSKGLLFSSFLVAVEDVARELGMNFSELFLRAVHEYSEYASVEMPHGLSQFW